MMVAPAHARGEMAARAYLTRRGGKPGDRFPARSRLRDPQSPGCGALSRCIPPPAVESSFLAIWIEYIPIIGYTGGLPRRHVRLPVNIPGEQCAMVSAGTVSCALRKPIGPDDVSFCTPSKPTRHSAGPAIRSARTNPAAKAEGTRKHGRLYGPNRAHERTRPCAKSKRTRGRRPCNPTRTNEPRLRETEGPEKHSRLYGPIRAHERTQAAVKTRQIQGSEQYQ
jgi:hypothetical protein